MPDPVFDSVEQLLEVASEEGLLTEVVVFALRAMKENPELAVEDAMADGFYEWVK